MRLAIFLTSIMVINSSILSGCLSSPNSEDVSDSDMQDGVSEIRMLEFEISLNSLQEENEILREEIESLSGEIEFLEEEISITRQIIDSVNDGRIGKIMLSLASNSSCSSHVLNDVIMVEFNYSFIMLEDVENLSFEFRYARIMQGDSWISHVSTVDSANKTEWLYFSSGHLYQPSEGAYNVSKWVPLEGRDHLVYTIGSISSIILEFQVNALVGEIEYSNSKHLVCPIIEDIETIAEKEYTSGLL